MASWLQKAKREKSTGRPTGEVARADAGLITERLGGETPLVYQGPKASETGPEENVQLSSLSRRPARRFKTLPKPEILALPLALRFRFCMPSRRNAR
jgi:hypothetical protein